jgi:hypothetical protein
MRTGRPKSIDKKLESICIKLAEQGNINMEIAKIINVSVSTLQEHIKNNKEFSDAYREAKKKFDLETVEQSLLRRALGGFTVREVQTRIVDGKKVETITDKEVLGEPSCIALYLRNRNPQDWCKEKQNLQVDVMDNVRYMSVAEARKILLDDPFGPTEEPV